LTARDPFTGVASWTVVSGAEVSAVIAGDLLYSQAGGVRRLSDGSPVVALQDLAGEELRAVTPANGRIHAVTGTRLVTFVPGS
jgi:hypothetical protein